MSSLGRASAVVAAGTLVSRVTGLLRNIVLAAALPIVAVLPLGQGSAANAFGVANQLPNNIYAIISSGLLAGVIVPQIIKAARHEDGGSAFVSKLLTLGVVALGAATVLAVALAPVLVQIYGSKMAPQTIALTLTFAYWCLPQLFFYGLYALLGEILNARRIFGPFAWSPIINNIVSIAGFGVFIWLFGAHPSTAGWTTGMVALIAGTATGGIVAQSVVLLLFWRRAGLRVRPDFQWRGIGLRQIGRLAGWTFLMVVVGQVAGAVQTNLVGAADGHGPSTTAMQYAWLVFMLPFSVIVLSIGTPYFTQLAEHVAEGRTDAVRADLDSSTRTIGVFMVAALAAIAASIVCVSRIFTRTADEAVTFALLLAAFLIALLPLSVQFVLQRTFYAHHDTRTPFLFTLVQALLVVLTAIIAWATLPLTLVAAGMALGQSLANIVQLVLAVWLLRRKIGPLGLRPAAFAYLRFLAAAVPAAGAGWLTFLLLGGASGWATASLFSAAASVVVIGVVTGVVYVAFLALLRAPELQTAVRAVRRFLPGR